MQCRSFKDKPYLHFLILYCQLHILILSLRCKGAAEFVYFFIYIYLHTLASSLGFGFEKYLIKN